MSTKKGKKPTYNIRAKIGEFWQTIGAAWLLDDGNISVKLNVVPVGEWDGGALMMPPLEEKEEDKE